MNGGVFSLGLYVFQNNLSRSFCKPFQVLNSISDLQYRHTEQQITLYASQIFTWMSIPLRDRSAVQICTTLILKLLHGYFGQLYPNSLLPPTFHTWCLSAPALQPGNMERTGIQSKHVTYGNLCGEFHTKVLVECPQMEGFPWRKQWSDPVQKKSTLTCLSFRMCLR